jgi:hypothetical protein
VNKKRKKFIFYKNIGNLLFFKKHSNLFIVLLDSRKKHLITLTSGLSKLNRTKKQKISPYNMINLINILNSTFKKYKIKFINFLIRQRISSYFFHFKKLLKLNNI